MAKKIIYIFAIFLGLVGILLLTKPALAFLPGDNPGPYIGLEYGQATGLGAYDVRFTTARIISAALGLLGMIAVVIVLYAGFKWMTAGGNEENIKSAQKILLAAVIGLVIIFSAYAITRFVMTNIYKATTGMEYYEGFY